MRLAPRHRIVSLLCSQSINAFAPSAFSSFLCGSWWCILPLRKFTVHPFGSMACVGARAIAVCGMQFRTVCEYRALQFYVGRICGAMGTPVRCQNVIRFGGNLGWMRNCGNSDSRSSCFARAALQLHSIKRRSRCTAVFPGVSVLSKPTPALSKCLKLKCRVTSQAGRRGFEPRLPLHLFNHLQGFQIPSIPSIKPQPIDFIVSSSLRATRTVG